MSVLNADLGWGSANYQLAVYFENKPPVEVYHLSLGVNPLSHAEFSHIIQNSSNNWRKLFNCYAKLAFALDAKGFESWQNLRDAEMLGLKSEGALLFSKPNFELESNRIHIISGRTYAAKLNLPFELNWLSPQFAINTQFNCIVSPYFDYRQLSNERLAILVKLVKSLAIKNR